jgi:hypothetical protein
LPIILQQLILGACILHKLMNASLTPLCLKLSTMFSNFPFHLCPLENSHQ